MAEQRRWYQHRPSHEPAAEERVGQRQCRAARNELFRRLAEGEGEMAEYAREMLAGRVAPGTHLYSSTPRVLSEDAVNDIT